MHSEEKNLTCFQFQSLHFILHLLATFHTHLGNRNDFLRLKKHIYYQHFQEIYLVEKYVDNSGSWILQIAGALETTCAQTKKQNTLITRKYV